MGGILDAMLSLCRRRDVSLVRVFRKLSHSAGRHPMTLARSNWRSPCHVSSK